MSVEMVDTKAEPLPVKRQKLSKFGELRIEVNPDQTIFLSLASGTAEIFGTEISHLTKYSFTNTSFCVFTWHGCTLKIEGNCEYYIPTLPPRMSDHPSIQYLELHRILEGIRTRKSQGPVVMVIGDKDSGKTSLAKTLFSYAARKKRRVGFVDLNSDVGVVSLPTTISCVVTEEPYCPKNHFSLTSPLVYPFGAFDSNNNEELYRKSCEKLAETLHRRMSNDGKLRNGGVIIDTHHYSRSQRNLVADLVRLFKVTHVYLLGEKGRLFYDLKKVVGGNVQVFDAVVKSGGATPKEEEKRKAQRSRLVHEYFYGIDKSLSPSPVTIKFSDISVVKVGGEWFAPESALPIGMKSVVDRCTIYDVMPSPELKNSILAVSNAGTKDGILENNIMGFLLVRKVDMKRSELHVLQPSPNKIEKKFLILGDMKWIDQ